MGSLFNTEDALWKGPRLMEMPTWVREGKPSPTGRVAFTTWKLWHADDEPLRSGLFGPVRLRFAKRVAITSLGVVGGYFKE